MLVTLFPVILRLKLWDKRLGRVLPLDLQQVRYN